MVAYVGDFGIAKILVENKTVTLTKTLGTLGYIELGKTFQAIEKFLFIIFFFFSSRLISQS